MSASWSSPGSSPRRSSGACGPASSARADWRKRRHGSRARPHPRGTTSDGAREGVRTCKRGPRRWEEETAWLERYRQLRDARFDELDKVVEELKRKEKVDGRKKRE